MMTFLLHLLANVAFLFFILGSVHSFYFGSLYFAYIPGEVQVITQNIWVNLSPNRPYIH